MLTIKKLKAMKQGIFDTGEAIDGPDGINMTNSGKMLRWVAVRGYVYDWTIYCGLAEQSESYIRDMGDKIYSRDVIKRLVACDDEALGMYRD